MNVWKQFERLMGPSEFRVGEVVSVGAYESILADAGGDQFKAKGTGLSVGQKAFVKDGVIQGQAPDLTDVGILYV
jgi:hypothetical protein